MNVRKRRLNRTEEYGRMQRGVNWKKRLPVLAVAMETEELISVFLSKLTKVPSKMMSNIGATTKVNFLIGMQILDKGKQEQLELFFAIRNRCVHDKSWFSYEECLNDSQKQQLKKFYPLDKRGEGEGYFSRAIKRLSMDCYEAVGVIMRVFHQQAINSVLDADRNARLAGLEKALQEEPKALAQEIEHVLSEGRMLTKGSIKRIPTELKHRIQESASTFAGHVLNRLHQTLIETGYARPVKPRGRSRKKSGVKAAK